MKKVVQKRDEVKPEVDKARRVYRAALDAIHRLDEILQQKRAYRDVFMQEAVGLRSKLKTYCERLMFYNPLEYGRKAEEVLWRKVFYDIIQLVKHNKRHIRPHGSLETAFRTHLAAATGYYYHLLLHLQTEFGLHLEGKLDFPMVSDHRHGKKFQVHNSKKKEPSAAVQEWALGACHRCLVYLGDIARYQQDFDHCLHSSTAERFYYQAFGILPEVGIPHNQLGSLVASRYFHCEAAYHYIRCLVSEKPFDGAQGNLRRLLEKNLKRYQELTEKSPRDLPPEQQRPRDIKRFFVRFLHLLDIFYNNSKSAEATQIQECCQNTLQDFNLCMFYEPVPSLEEEPCMISEHLQYLDDSIVFKIVIMCMATIHLLEKNGSRQVTAAMAFLLALFSHILNHVVIRLQASLYEKENPTKLLTAGADEDEGKLENVENGRCSPRGESESSQNHGSKMTNVRILTKPDNQHAHQNSDVFSSKILEKKKKLRLRNLKRRRRRHHSGSSHGSDGSVDESDLSEGGEEMDDDDLLSEESDDDIVSYLEHDSDSDMSDTLMESQELPPGFSMTGNHNQLLNGPSQPYLDGEDDGSSQDRSIWTDAATNVSLIHFSSELFSTSVTFLGQKLELNLKKRKLSNGTEDGDVDSNPELQQIPIEPVFSSYVEAQHAAEITHKLNNFVIETDTENSAVPTDTEFSSALSETDVEGDNQSQRSESDRYRTQHIVNVIQNEGLLCVIKVFCDWMKCQTGVITTCAQSSQALWCRLSVLLNFLPLPCNLPRVAEIYRPERLQSILLDVGKEDWKQQYPLREDVNLHLFQPLADVHGSIDFDKRFKLSEMQECFLRISCLHQFGHWVSSVPGLDFTYRKKEAMFFGPTHAGDTVESERIAQERMVNAESRRNQLMKDMAQLRLQAEVSQLEGSLESSDQPIFPTYLVPHTSSLCEALPLVKQLTQSARCIIIIPLAVIDILDLLKKESPKAREAIRWLELEFRHGNRYIRAQKSNEKIRSPGVKDMKKHNREAWCILEILDCCRYLAQQSGDFSPGGTVTILTSKDLQTWQGALMVKDILKKNQEDDVSLENITDFLNKWKEIWKSKG